MIDLGAVIAKIIAKFGLHLAVLAGAGTVFFMYDSSRVASGVRKEHARITEATSNAARIGKAAADKSLRAQSGGVRGKRDPLTRDD